MQSMYHVTNLESDGPALDRNDAPHLKASSSTGYVSKLSRIQAAFERAGRLNGAESFLQNEPKFAARKQALVRLYWNRMKTCRKLNPQLQIARDFNNRLFWEMAFCLFCRTRFWFWIARREQGLKRQLLRTQGA
jgi:hypothetical protein